MLMKFQSKCQNFHWGICTRTCGLRTQEHLIVSGHSYHEHRKAWYQLYHFFLGIRHWSQTGIILPAPMSYMWCVGWYMQIDNGTALRIHNFTTTKHMYILWDISPIMIFQGDILYIKGDNPAAVLALYLQCIYEMYEKINIKLTHWQFTIATQSSDTTGDYPTYDTLLN